MNLDQALQQVYKQAESMAKARKAMVRTPEQIAAHKKYQEEQKAKADAYYQTEEGKKALEETAAFWNSYGEARAKGELTSKDGWIGD